MPSVIAILLHVGKIISAVKDVEKAVADLVAKNMAAEPGDVKAILEDLKGLVDSGLISIPGVSAAQIDQVIADLEKAVGA